MELLKNYRNKMVRAIVCALLFLLPVAAPWKQQHAQEVARSGDGRYYERLARQAYSEKDYAAFLANIKRAAELRPNHPRLTYLVALAYALNGYDAEALEWLGRMASMGLVSHPEADEGFRSIKDSEGFKTVVEKFRRNARPVVNSKPAFMLSERGLVPEGIAYDPQTKSFFLGSIYRRKIVRVRPGGVATDFATERDGLWSVFGMRVDSSRRLLWACTAAHPQMSNFRKEEGGTSAVLKFDLRTGRLVKRYVLSNKPEPHLLGDLVIDGAGNVFVSDSLTPAIYVIRPGGDRLETFVKGGEFISPQGVAPSSDGQCLFVADYAKGIFRIELKNKRITLLECPPASTMIGIDGLYFNRGALVGVQNGINPARIVKLHLDKSERRIMRLEVLEANNPLFDEPTLAVIVRDDLYFIANSQWGAVDEQGNLAAAEKLKEPLILKLRLKP
jgi:sugar lactone lactonase YvrE